MKNLQSKAAPHAFEIISAERRLLSENSNAYFEQLLKGPPVEVDGQRLHPKLQYLKENEGSTASFEMLEKLASNWECPEGIRQIREGIDLDWSARALDVSNMVKVAHDVIKGRDGNDINLIISHPRRHSRRSLPIIIYSHGGGMLVGSAQALQKHAELLSYLCEAVVVNVCYRLAPEHKFPAAFHDVFDTYAWCKDNAATLGGDGARIACAGDSVGGALCLAVAREQCQLGGQPLAGLLLYYPMTDTSEDYASYDYFGEGYGLDRNFTDMMNQLAYNDPSDVEHPYVRPISWPDLSFLPPTIIAIAGFDLLRDQGIKFAERMEKSGCEVSTRQYKSLNHSFIKHAGVVDDAEDACTATTIMLKRILDRSE